MKRKKSKKDSFQDLIFKVISENQEFLQSTNKRKKIFSEISNLMLDGMDYLSEFDYNHDPRGPFVFNALNPISQGIYLTILSGNINASYMQLRLLVEYLALTYHAKKSNANHVLEKLEETRIKMENDKLGKTIEKFDHRALGLWKKSSKWFHAKSHSRKIENIIINDEVKLWQIIQPSPYDEGDEEVLSKFGKEVKLCRLLVKKLINTK